ncbi:MULTISPECIES: hypothetical protein [unclassified Geomicrobium]|uniref:hypothetical protein n=1 Tax=unclassified Geomicrobium TaxID=2628951 RepID=UPI0005A86D3A|nr:MULTISPECIES: hypothetical protein [unclassified Geomicrobium]
MVHSLTRDRVLSLVLGIGSVMFLPLGALLAIVGLLYFPPEDRFIRIGRAFCWLAIILAVLGLTITIYNLIVS